MNDIDRRKILVRYIINNGIAQSQKDLGHKLGYSNESSFSQVINGKVKTPNDFPKKLKNLVPDLNINWLLTGEGPMIKEVPDRDTALTEYNIVNNTDTVPLLPVSAIGGSLNDFVASVMSEDCERIVSPIKGVDFAISVTGNSMAPEYPNGSKVLIKRIDEKAFIEWGRVYVLDTRNGSVIKKIMPGSNDNCVRCESLNPDYPDFEVCFADMFGMYRVLMLLTEK